jgi:two-component system NtrC family sensor kinase
MLKVMVISFDEAVSRLSAPVPGLPALEVHAAESGFDAVEIAETLRPQIAVLNLDAPGPDGFEVLRHLKEIDPELQVIAAGDYCRPDLVVRALEMGASDFFPASLVDTALAVTLQRAAEKIWLRNKLEESVQEIRKRYDFEHELIQTSIDGIIANDRSGKLILFNEGASRIYGYSPEEAVSRVHVTQLYLEGEARQIKKKIYGPEYGGPGRLINYETRARTRDGQLSPILLSAALIYEGDQEVATVGYFKDLTEIRRQSERLLAVDRGVTEMAYVMKDILNCLKIGSFLVEKELARSGSERFQKGWGLITRSIGRMSRLILNLLGYARTESGQRESVSISELAEEVCDSLLLLAREKGVVLETELAPELPRLIADREKIRSSIHQLICNAVEAVPEKAGGRVCVRTRAADGRRVSLEVEDTGRGIAPELQEKIFEPFFTTKGGSGLGLAIIRRIAREHHGTIRVRSGQNGGAIFTLLLPCGPE